MTGRHFFYCSELSSQVAERSYGTASIGDAWLLLEYRQSWGPKAFQDSTLSPTVKAYLTRAVKLIPRSRLLFIRQDRINRGRLTLFVVRSCESDPAIVRFELGSYEELSGIDIPSAVAGSSLAGGSLMNKPVFLVCTHGKRDKCCAKFGYPVYKALREFTGGSVWQSSHVGGDRFAANLVCFPHGLFYAHVTEEAGKRIVSEYNQRRLVLDEYRGRTCYPYPVQAAEFFVRKNSGITDINDLRYLKHEQRGENTWRVRFTTLHDGGVHEVTVISRVSEFKNYITCHSTEERRVVQYLLGD